MAASARAVCLALALAAATAASAQQTGRITVEPLPPPGGVPSGVKTLAPPSVNDAPAPPSANDLPAPSGGSETLPQPRFVRVPSQQGAGQTPPEEIEPQWERSPDGRFYRAPQASHEAAPDAPAPVVPIDPPPTELRSGARLRELDKMTGQTKTFEIAVGETRDVDRLRIELDGCRSPEGNDVHGTEAFLKVWDTKRPQDEVFSGWMFAESPALSAIDHPRYDLWVISCTTSDVAGSASSQ